MARFDVFARRRALGYVVQVQSEWVERFDTSVVVPLLPAGAAPPPHPLIHLVLPVRGAPHLFATQLLASVHHSELGRPVDNLDAWGNDITRVLDALFTGL